MPVFLYALRGDTRPGYISRGGGAPQEESGKDLGRTAGRFFSFFPGWGLGFCGVSEEEIRQFRDVKSTAYG